MRQQRPARRQHRRRKQQLAAPDLPAREAVVEAEAEHAAEERALHQRQRGGVRPDDRRVGQQQEPAAEEGVVMVAQLLDTGVGAAGVGMALHQVVVVERDDPHHQRADDDPQHRAQGPRHRQERRPRHDERAPADGAAERERPRRQDGEVAAMGRVANGIRDVAFHDRSFLFAPPIVSPRAKDASGKNERRATGDGRRVCGAACRQRHSLKQTGRNPETPRPCTSGAFPRHDWLRRAGTARPTHPGHGEPQGMRLAKSLDSARTKPGPPGKPREPTSRAKDNAECNRHGTDRIPRETRRNALISRASRAGGERGVMFMGEKMGKNGAE